MSNRPCNYCIMKKIVADAKVHDKQVVTRPGSRKLGGTDVYILPKGVELPPQTTEELSEEFKDEYFVAWFMELSKECAC